MLISIHASSLGDSYLSLQIVGLWKDPDGANIIVAADPQHHSANILESTIHRESAAQLAQEIQQLKSDLRRVWAIYCTVRLFFLGYICMGVIDNSIL